MTSEPRNPKHDQVAARFLPIVRPLEDAVADDAAQEVTQHASEKNTGGKKRRVVEVQVVAVQEKLRYPGEKKPQRPAVAEIDHRHRKHAAGQPEKRDALGLMVRARTLPGKCFQLGRSDPGMIRGFVAEIRSPHHGPAQAQRSQDDERSAPRHQRNQSGDQRRSERISEPRRGMRDSLREAALGLRHPCRHGARSRGQSGYSDAKHHAAEQHGRQAVGQAHEHRGCRPDDREHRQRQARSKSVTHPAADDLKYKVRISKSGEDQPHLSIVQMQFVFEDGGRGADVHPDDVVDRIHQAEQDEHNRCSRNRSSTRRGCWLFAVHSCS